jgi:hypothetical protein
MRAVAMQQSDANEIEDWYLARLSCEVIDETAGVRRIFGWSRFDLAAHGNGAA